MTDKKATNTTAPEFETVDIPTTVRRVAEPNPYIAHVDACKAGMPTYDKDGKELTPGHAKRFKATDESHTVAYVTRKMREAARTAGVTIHLRATMAEKGNVKAGKDDTGATFTAWASTKIVRAKKTESK